MPSHESEKPVAVYGAIAADLLIAATKFAVALFTGSSAMLAESIHSLVDAGNGSLLLLGEFLSKRPADENHPFGHGQELYFWTLIVAILLFGVGGGMSVVEGIARIRNPSPVESPIANYVVLGFAALFEGSSFLVAHRELRKDTREGNFWQSLRASKDPSVFAVLFEDSAALIGLVVAFAGVFLEDRWNNPTPDAAASILIGFTMAVTATLLAYKSKQLLLGSSLDSRQVQDICAIAQNDPAVERIRHPLTMHFGPDEVLLSVDVQFRKGLPNSDIPVVIDRLEKGIRARHPDIKRIYIEAESLIGSETTGVDGHPAAEEAGR